MSPLEDLFSAERQWKLSTDSPTPLYYQLYRLLKAGILDGSFARGIQLPTEKQLSAKFGVSRITSRRALDELASEGLVERQRGKGTYVVYRYRRPPMHAPMVGLLQEIESIGRQSTATVLDCGLVRPPPEVRQKLELDEQQTVLHLARVRHRNDRRFGYYASWTKGVDVPPDLSVLEDTPRMSYFRARGLVAASIRQTINAQPATPEVAGALRVKPGSPLLSVTRLTFAEPHQQGPAVDFLHILYHPQRFEYCIDLELSDLD